MAKLTIVDERESISNSISEVNAGEIFNYEGKYFIMVAHPDDYLAIDLESGQRYDFSYETVVIRVNATLIIEWGN